MLKSTVWKLNCATNTCVVQICINEKVYSFKVWWFDARQVIKTDGWGVFYKNIPCRLNAICITKKIIMKYINDTPIGFVVRDGHLGNFLAFFTCGYPLKCVRWNQSKSIRSSMCSSLKTDAISRSRPFLATFHLHNLMNSIHCNAIRRARWTWNDSLS